MFLTGAYTEYFGRRLVGKSIPCAGKVIALVDAGYGRGLDLLETNRRKDENSDAERKKNSTKIIG